MGPNLIVPRAAQVLQTNVDTFRSFATLLVTGMVLPLLEHLILGYSRSVLKAFTLITSALLLSSCSSVAPNSARACESYFDASEQVASLVTDGLGILASLSDQEKVAFFDLYQRASSTQIDQSVMLTLALSSEDLGTGDLAQNVEDLTALLRQEAALFDYGGGDAVDLLRILKLESDIEDQCKKLGARL